MKKKLLQEFERYKLYAIYNDNGQFLYNKCEQKIPSAKHNDKIVAEIEKRTKSTITLTEEEKQPDKKNYFKYIPQCTKDEVVNLHKKGISLANVSAMVALDKSLIVKIIKESENGGPQNE